MIMLLSEIGGIRTQTPVLGGVVPSAELWIRESSGPPKEHKLLLLLLAACKHRWSVLFLLGTACPVPTNHTKAYINCKLFDLLPQAYY